MANNNSLLKTKYKTPKISSGLIEKIAKQDTKALEVLYNESSYAVFGFALSIVKNRQVAQDVMQEVYIKIFEKANTYSDKGKPMAWIFTITRNICLKEFRDKNNKTVDIDALYDIESTSLHYENVENQVLLSKLLQVLNEEERQIVLMHAMSGLKHKEISKMLNMPLSTVLSKYNRSMQKLKQGVNNEK